MCLSTPSVPMKPPVFFLSFPITQPKPASMGVVVSSRSEPYKHMPASNLKLSRAPKPVSCTLSGLLSSCATSKVWSGGMEIWEEG